MLNKSFVRITRICYSYNDFAIKHFRTVLIMPNFSTWVAKSVMILKVIPDAIDYKVGIMVTLGFH